MKDSRIILVAGLLWAFAFVPMASSADETSLDGLHGREAAAKISAAAPGTVFLRKGTRVTREELIQEARKQQGSAAEAAKKSTVPGDEELRKARAAFEQKQKAELEALNTRLRAQFEAEKARHAMRQLSEKRTDEIRNEAGILLQKAKTASPKEKEQIEKRAAELLKEVQQQKQ
jgi:hypothetical protein